MDKKKRSQDLFTFGASPKLHPTWRVRAYILKVGFNGWIQKSADDFEFSAERLSENAKCIKIIVFAELLTAISSIYVQSLQQIVNKNIKTFPRKMPNWHQIPVIFMIYSLLSRNFAVRIYALFPQIFLDWKAKSADFYTFRMYERWSQKFWRMVEQFQNSGRVLVSGVHNCHTSKK